MQSAKFNRQNMRKDHVPLRSRLFRAGRLLPTILLILFVVQTLASAATLNVSVPAITVSNAVAGTQFDVPVSIQIPDGAANQGMMRLYFDLTSVGDNDTIAPVVSGNRIVSTFESVLAGYDVKFSPFSRTDTSGNHIARSTAVVDLGGNSNRNVGIGGSTVVVRQRWQFTRTPQAGRSYTLHVVFPATKSRYYNASGQAVPFETQIQADGSVQAAPLGDINGDNAVDWADLAILLSAMDSTQSSGNWDSRADVDSDLEVTSSDLTIVLENMQ